MLLIVLLATASTPSASVSQTAGICTPILRQTSTPSGIPQQRYWDPILFPGQVGYPIQQAFVVRHGPAHWHTFFGNTSLTPDGTGDAAAPTSCTGGFQGNFWTPALIVYSVHVPQGLRLDPATVEYRFRTPAGAVMPPPGLGIIAHGATWDCGPGTATGDVPLACPVGQVSTVVKFPRFWDGVNLHLPGEAHTSFTRVPGWVRLPTLRVRVTYPVGNRQLYTLSGFNEPIVHLSVNGVPICCETFEGGFNLAEDERSFHVDVLYP